MPSTVRYNTEITNKTPELFIDLVLHTDFDSRHSYIEAIVTFLLDHRDNESVVHACLEYLMIAAGYDVKSDVIIHLLNKKSNCQVEYMWAERLHNSEVPF